MKIDRTLLKKVFDPHFIARAARAFDRGTVVIVSVTWGSAILFMLFALYALSLSTTARQQVVAAAATEPGVPQMQARQPEAREMQPIIDRLKRRFPSISFILGTDKNLSVTASDGGQFRLWLTVLSYIDTISPQYRWKIKDFCVGLRCNGSVPMRAVLTPERISFTAPNLEP